MNWIKRIFNWKKAPKATNEMKPIEVQSDYLNIIRSFVFIKYYKVKYSWKRSPKHYYILYYNNKLILKRNDKLNCSGELIGNLYTLYQQYYGKENKN